MIWLPVSVVVVAGTFFGILAVALIPILRVSVGPIGGIGMPITILVTLLSMASMPFSVVLMLLIKPLRSLLGHDAVLILHILPGMTLTRSEGEGDGGSGQAEKFHDAP